MTAAEAFVGVFFGFLAAISFFLVILATFVWLMWRDQPQEPEDTVSSQVSAEFDSSMMLMNASAVVSSIVDDDPSRLRDGLSVKNG